MDDRIKMYSKLDYAELVEQNLNLKNRLKAMELESKLIDNEYFLFDVSENTHTDEARIKNRYNLTKAQELGEIGTWELDIVNSKVVSTQVNYKNIGAKHGSRLTYENLLSCIHPDDRAYVKSEWEAAIKGKPYDIEHRVVADGQVKWIRGKANLKFDENGKAISAIGFTQNITPFKEAELKLKASEKKFRLLAHNTNDWEYWKDENNQYIFISPSCERITGYLAEEFYANPNLFVELVREDYRKAYSEHSCESEKTVSEHYLEFPIIDKNNHETWIEHSCIPIFDENGKFLGRRGNNRNITKRKNTEFELLKAKEIAEQNEVKIKLNEKRLMALVELNQMTNQSDDLICGFMLNKAIELTQCKFGFLGFVNEEQSEVDICKWSDSAMKEGVGKNGNMNFDIEVADLWSDVIEQGKALIVNDYRKPNSNGNGGAVGHLEIENYLSIPTFHQDKIIAIISVANKDASYTKTDINQVTLLLNGMRRLLVHRKEKNELINAKHKAEESDRLKSAFLSNMSHEIRTPMNGILGFTALLKDANLSVENQKDYIQIIEKSSDRLLNTVNDIIEISKIESGELSYTKSEVDIIAHLNSLVSFFRPEAEKKGLEIIVNNIIDRNDLSIITDEIKLDSILSNLIKNAIKYTDEGTIKVGFKIENEQILFLCQDTGIGIPRNRHDAIFNRFEQADVEDKLAMEGSGLGLAIVKSYVELMNGKIWLQSEEGLGSSFYVLLPFIRCLKKK